MISVDEIRSVMNSKYPAGSVDVLILALPITQSLVPVFQRCLTSVLPMYPPEITTSLAVGVLRRIINKSLLTPGWLSGDDSELVMSNLIDITISDSGITEHMFITDVSSLLLPVRSVTEEIVDLYTTYGLIEFPSPVGLEVLVPGNKYIMVDRVNATNLSDFWITFKILTAS